MMQLPRIAVGTVQKDADRKPVFWALLNLLERQHLQVQTFFSQARFVSLDEAAPVTGQDPRHVDSWLMSPEVCREIFQHGAGSSDVALVEGRYHEGQYHEGQSAAGWDACGSVPHLGDGSGGCLDTLCDWLDLPRLAILDTTQMDACRLPDLRGRVDAVILDRVVDPYQASCLRTTLEAIWGVPVLGVLEELPDMRVLIAGMPRGARPSLELCRALGDRLAPRLDLPRLLQLARQRDFSPARSRLFRDGPETVPLNVAYAYDEAFNCYFPDTLDLLESWGATIRDFSPLRSDCLPPDTDLIYLGCGPADRYAEELAGNHCIKQALRSYAGRGGRIYAEGSGLAYLCQALVLGPGRHLPMAGLLPAVALFNSQSGPLCPVEVTLGTSSWLGQASGRLRGYLNTSWSIEPVGPLNHYAAEPQHRMDLIGRQNVFGSRLHLNFAAQPQFLASFFLPSLSRTGFHACP